MTNSKIISSLIWKFLERGGTQVVQFIVQIILARILLPEDYGVVAIVTIFIAIATVFVQNGFNTALIQKKEVDDVDLSSVLYLSLFIALILYIIIFFTAPLISHFYNNQLLTPILRVLSLTLFFGAFNSIQNAIVARSMDFKKYFFSSLGAIIVSGIIGVILAYSKFGVWALVVQQLINMAVICIILWFTVKWRPRLIFSIERVKVLFSYGWKLLCSSLIDTLYTNIYDLVIGKKYTSSDLAFYNRGKQFPYLIVNNVNGSISSVLLPAMSSKQDDKIKVKQMTRRTIKTSSFIMFPLMIGLAAVAKPMVSLILTDKWLPCVPFLQILCFSYSLWLIHTANLQAINALGRSDIFLKLEIIKKIIGIVILLITVPLGLYAMAFGQIISGIISSFINAYPNKKLLNYGYFEQIKDILPSLLLALLMGILVYLVNFMELNSIITLIIQILLGMTVYIGLSCAFKLESLNYAISKFKKRK